MATTPFEDAPERDAPPEPADLADAPSTLEAAAPSIERMQRAAAGFVIDVRRTLDELLATFAAQEPSLTEALAASDEMETEAQAAFGHRFGRNLAMGNQERSRHDSIEQWTTGVEQTLTRMSHERIPFFAKARLVQQVEYQKLLGGALGRKRSAEHLSLTAAYKRFLDAATEAATSAFAARAPQLEAMLAAMGAPPPIVGSLGEGALGEAPIPGVGRLLVQVGRAELSPLSVALRAPSGLGQVTPAGATIPTGRLGVPAMLDFDRDGGLVTDRAATINDILLRLVALLPAGQVKATIVDPARLGESASFLFGLGDAAETIIGTKVRTTERELSDALLELEEHITLVTQKYLQGTFDSLTAYNIAADEVAEPYRVLVLYDYPKGFVRAGGDLDVEALARLRKLVEAGRRCGVFTLVVATPGIGGAVADPIMKLPWLWDGRAPHPRWTALLSTGNADAPGFEIEQSAPEPSSANDNQLTAARTAGVRLFTVGASASWLYRAEQPAAESTTAAILAHVERGIALAQDVRVSLAQVAQLASAKLARDVARGTRTSERLPFPADPESWWHGSSLDEIGAIFGRVGARDAGTLRLDSRTMSGAVIGGRPGAGKSVLIHALIASLATRYSPEELELYLVDFKEGVEFKCYAVGGGLPHARVVAIESEREFGLSVLQSLDEEITRRGVAFRDGAGEEVNLGAYRRRTGKPLPRIVLIVDEFHVLFERDDKLAGAAGELLDRIVRQGRAFGVHAVLASQTLAGTSGLGRHTLNLLPIRIALQCSDADSRLLLADDNADARLLSRPGEGILNSAEGLRDANVRFQAAYSAPEERATMVNELRALADQRGLHDRPVVFEGNAPARVEELPTKLVRSARGAVNVAVPVGLPLTLAGPVIADLRREPGGNLLLIADDEMADAMLSVAVVTLAASGVATDLLDFGPLDSPLAETLALLGDAAPRVSRRRDVAERLQALAALVEERQALSELRAAPHVCVLAALHRARELDGTGASDEQERLEAILRDGPDVGVHVIAWCDKAVSLGRRLSTTATREFGMRLLGPMSRDDSFALVDSDLAALTGPSQAVLDDHDRAATTRLRRFAAPSAAWVSSAVEGST